jgi:hypothetical protein
MQKVQIKVTEQTTKLIDVEMPSYYLLHGMYVAITALHVIQISDNTHFIALITSGETVRYGASIYEAINYGKRTEQNDFKTAFDKCIKCLTEQYQLSMDMNLEPKEGEKDEAPKEQIADTQAAEEKAPEEKEGAGKLID